MRGLNGGSRPGVLSLLGLLLGLFSERVVDTGGDLGRALGRPRVQSGVEVEAFKANKVI